MILAIPVAQGEICMHFGHCEQFTLVKIDPQAKTVLDVSHVTPPPHAPGVLPPWLAQQGADAIIAGGMGQRAQQLFAGCGVEVIVGVTGGTPEQIAQAYLDGTLETGQNVCDH